MIKYTKNLLLQLNNIFRFVFFNLCNYLPDKLFLSLKYRLQMKKTLNLKCPMTYNEKLQWLKLYDRQTNYTIYVDKYAVREYIAKTIGEEYLIPLLGVWDKVEDIDFNKLPNQFVLKTNHDSGTIIICKDKTNFNIEEAKEKLKKSLKTDYYLVGREWPYKNIPRKIIAEKYMEDMIYKELRDYKFFCFNGVVKACFIATDRQKKDEEVKFDFFDSDFNHLVLKHGHENAIKTPEKPLCFKLMKNLASKLSQNIKQVRVDLYEINNKVYFGELTLFHHGGWIPFIPDKWDSIFGSWIKLPEQKY